VPQSALSEELEKLPARVREQFPHVGQAFLIERSVTDLHGVNLSNIAALGVTSQTPDRAEPARLTRQVQGHWAIESLHWLRDHVYREDHSPSEPVAAQGQWHLYATSLSEPTASSDAPTSPKPPAGQAAT
jgi:hypothetical protein